MFDDEADGALRQYAAAVDRLAAVSLTSLSRDELLAHSVRTEMVSRRLATVDHAIVGELDRRGVCHELAEPSTAALLRRLLRIDGGEAKARVAAARDLGERVGLSGEPLGPIFAHVAAAQAAGQISSAHARVIVKAVEDLPAEVALAEDDHVQEFLTAAALDCAPQALSGLARLVHDYLDPDGTLTKDADRRRRRGLTWLRAATAWAGYRVMPPRPAWPRGKPSSTPSPRPDLPRTARRTYVQQPSERTTPSKKRPCA